MKRFMLMCLSALTAVVVLGPGIASGQQAKTYKFMAALNAAQEVPHPAGVPAKASGRFTATVTGKSMKFTLTFAHLTGPGMQAHIHLGARGTSGIVVVPLCTPCRSPVSKTLPVTAAVLKNMLAGKTYVNVHTAKNASGEIRGQVTRAG